MGTKFSTKKISNTVELGTNGHGSETRHRIIYKDVELAESFKELISVSKQTVTDMSGCNDACDWHDNDDE